MHRDNKREVGAQDSGDNQSWLEQTPPALEIDDLFQKSVDDKVGSENAEKQANTHDTDTTDTGVNATTEMPYTHTNTETSSGQGGTTIINNYIQAPPETSNTLGLAGFILSLVAFLLSWIPILGGLLWLVGAILSIIGLFKAPRGFAIAGTIISFLMIFVFLFFFMGFIMLAALSPY